MRSSTVRVAAALVLVLAAVALPAREAAGQQQQPTGGGVRKDVLRAVVHKGDMAVLLPALAEAYDVTIGLEVDPQQPTSWIQIDVRNATLRDVLDAIMRAEPRYAWREGEGSVDLYPVAGGSPVLDAVVGRLLTRNLDRLTATEALLSVNEVRAGMAAAGLTRGEAAGQGGGARFSLELERVTARAAMHEIVKKSGAHFWVFRRTGDAGETFSISIRQGR